MEGFLAFMIFFGIPIGIKLYLAHCKKQEEDNLRRTNPEVYAHLKQIEHEEKMMEHDKKRMRHQNVQTGVNIIRRFFE